MRTWELVAAALVLCGTLACTSTELRAYEHKRLSTVSFQATNRRSFRTGHLPVGGKATVLEVYRFDPRNPIAVDDEGCDILLIELPRPPPGSPFTVESPRAFLRRCACTWGNCKEEASLGGHVRIEESTDQGIKAAVNLRFPSGRVKTRGWFRFEAPKLWDAAPGTVLEPR